MVAHGPAGAVGNFAAGGPDAGGQAVRNAKLIQVFPARAHATRGRWRGWASNMPCRDLHCSRSILSGKVSLSVNPSAHQIVRKPMLDLRRRGQVPAFRQTNVWWTLCAAGFLRGPKRRAGVAKGIASQCHRATTDAAGAVGARLGRVNRRSAGNIGRKPGASRPRACLAVP